MSEEHEQNQAKRTSYAKEVLRLFFVGLATLGVLVVFGVIFALAPRFGVVLLVVLGLVLLARHREEVGTKLREAIQPRRSEQGDTTWRLFWAFVALIPLGIAVLAVLGVIGAFVIFIGAIGALVVGIVIDYKRVSSTRTTPSQRTPPIRQVPATAERNESPESPPVAGHSERTVSPEGPSRSGTSPLRTQLQHIPNMSGSAFERYMANVFKALGYNARVLGGAGDQGVDLLLQKAGQRIAVQCKNLRRPVGNPPVQQVLAGKLYHKTDRAWVVAPAGYTDGARVLARRTEVVLFDRRSIEKLIQQAEHHAAEELRSSPEPVVAPHSEQGRKDRANYTLLLEHYEANLDIWERLVNTRAQHAGTPEVEQKLAETLDKIYSNLERPMGIFQKLDILERRNTGMQKEREKRAELKARQKLIESKLGAASPPQRATTVAARRDYVVGDTVTLAIGEKRLTVRSYESPAILRSNVQPEEGHEFVAIDVEWCADPNSGEHKVQANAAYFTLHMPDNTRMPRSFRKEPRLPLATLLPSDCVRGWVTFQKPRDVKPRFIIYEKGSTVVKWAISS